VYATASAGRWNHLIQEMTGFVTSHKRSALGQGQIGDSGAVNAITRFDEGEHVRSTKLVEPEERVGMELKGFEP